MLIRISSAKCIGINALEVTVEVNVSNGIGIHLVGLADIAVKESLLRTVTALQSLGYHVPGKKIVINLAPADMQKRGSGYDLPIALGIIAASQQVDMPDLGKYVIMGELGLDGTVRNVPGAIPIVEMAGENNYEGCIMPLESALETQELDCCKVFGVESLVDVVRILRRDEGYEELLVSNMRGKLQTVAKQPDNDFSTMDFSEIMGQEIAKRGLEIAAAGGHSAILIGSPGSGKSSLAKAMCKILPPMTIRESIVTSKIYSVCGRGNLSSGLIHSRPFRGPHSSCSVAAMIGGGSDNILPGEISLAHNGVLFLDEFLEIPKRNIEVLRAPMEDKKITLSRLRTKVEYPADFTLIAAANPCPCGYWGEGDRCTCTEGKRRAYLEKLSGPMMDRIDIQIWTRPVKAASLLSRDKAESSADVASRVRMARELQQKRFAEVEGVFCNAQMQNSLIEKFCPLDSGCKDFLSRTMDRMGLSARACTRIIKLARTIADLESVRLPEYAGSPAAAEKEEVDFSVNLPIKIEHLAEAVSYRFLDKQNPE